MLNSFEIESLLVGRGFRVVETKTHAIGFRHPALDGQLVYLKDGRSHIDAPRKSVRKQPLVLHRDVLQLPGFSGTRAAALGPNRNYKNGNMTTFPAHDGSSATGVAVDVEDSDALRELLALLGVNPHPSFDSEAQAFFEGFMDAGNPQFVYWLPRYIQTLRSVREALQQDVPDSIFDLVWKSSDNSVANAGQGVLGFDAVERMRVPLTGLIHEIAEDGSAAQFDVLVTRLEQWRQRGELPKVPRLLLARAFAAIHPDRYHTTVDVAKQDRILPWFEQHTGFATSDGNWAAKAEALTAHLDRCGVFAGDLERRNMFPWYVFDQLRDAAGVVPFRPGHTSRPASGEAEGSAWRRTIEYRQNVIQDRLVELLRDKYGRDAVATEHPTGTGGRADALVERDDGSRELYEIKPAGSAREAVRQALGQLLEYAYRRNGLRPAAFHVVSDASMDDVTQEYLQTLETSFGLKLGYLQVASGGPGDE